MDKKYEFRFGYVDYGLLEGVIGLWFLIGLEGI